MPRNQSLRSIFTKAAGVLRHVAWRARRRRDALVRAHPLLGYYTYLARFLERARTHNLNVLAAGIGLYASLALLPFIASVSVIYGMFAEPQAVQSAVRSMLSIAPTRAQELVADRLLEVIGTWNGGLPALLAGVMLALYAASRAARSILAALNLIHGLEQRTFLRRWAASLSISLAGGAMTLLALFAIAATGYLGELMPNGFVAWMLIRATFWLGLAVAASISLGLLYRYGPNGASTPWLEVLPGAMAGSLLWLLGSAAFSAYIPVVARYDRTYGSLAAIVVLQLWLYGSSFILLLGAQLNVEIRGFRAAGSERMATEGA